MPYTNVEFELAGDHVRIREAKRESGEDISGRLALDALRGTADTRMTTGLIMALTRDDARPRQRGK